MSKDVAANAQAALFEVNVIRVSKFDHAYCPLEIRSIEITGEYSWWICSEQNLIPECIERFQENPKLQTLSLAVDRLVKFRRTARDFVGNDSRWESFECVGLGVFELKPSAEWVARLREPGTSTSLPKVYLRNLELVENPPQAREIALYNTAPDIFEYVDSRFGRPNRSSIGLWDFAWWLRSHEDFRLLPGTPEDHGLSEVEVNNAESFGRHNLRTMNAIPAVNEALSENLRIFDLSGGEGHSSELLEWATQLLGLNLGIRMWEGPFYCGFYEN